MPGPPVLLGSYAARVISWVTGVLSSCRSSGGVSLVLQNLVGARWSSLQTSDGRVFFLIARFVLASASTWRFGYSMFGFSVALLPGTGGVSFAFVPVLCRCAPDPPLLLSWRASLYRPSQRETNRNGRMLYPVGAVRSSWSAWAAHRRRCVPFILPQVVA